MRWGLLNTCGHTVDLTRFGEFKKVFTGWLNGSYDSCVCSVCGKPVGELCLEIDISELCTTPRNNNKTTGTAA